LDIISLAEKYVQTIKNDPIQSRPGLLMEAVSSFWQTRDVDETFRSGWEYYKTFQLEFEELEDEERENLLNDIEREINEGLFKKSGPHRRSDWDAGWGENLSSLLTSEELDFTNALSPKYFRKHSYERLGGVHVKVDPDDGIETKLLGFIVDALIQHLVQKYKAREIWEFGCGTGHHLLRIRDFLPGVQLVGLDWAESSQSILQEASKRLKAPEVTARNFDYFNPNFELKPDNPSSPTLFFTVASLEQVGDQHEQFLKYILSVKPSIVLHLEPIHELLGSSREENLSKRYFSARNYLSGYLTALRNLEAEGHISILSAERTGLGSMFVEGYSIIAWEPSKSAALSS
jgi:hypothetical protein